MIELVGIFSEGGALLYHKQLNQTITQILLLINNIISSHINHPRLAAISHNNINYSLLVTHNSHIHSFLLFHQTSPQPYLQLLTRITDRFVDIFNAHKEQHTAFLVDFYPKFDGIFEEILHDFDQSASLKTIKTPRSFQETQKYKNTLESSQQQTKTAKPFKKKNAQVGIEKTKKKGRTWNDSKKPPSEKAIKALDYSLSTESSSNLQADKTSLIDQTNLGQKNKDGLYDAQEMIEPSSDDSDSDDSKEPKKSNFFSYIKTLIPTASTTTTDSELIQPILEKMSIHLQNKNVAHQVVQTILESVSKNLSSSTSSSLFTTKSQSLKSQLHTALATAITQILSPKTSIDLLHDIITSPNPYSIVFVGVNGVGKSTNLSKVCFWLLQNGQKVLVAACDTFRSGAVEQLKVHVRNLNELVEEDGVGCVELFQKGYGKDAAGIAKDALAYAKANSFDVVLIDTAGRMQDNEPLMKSLAKLVIVNNPDKILFVGEALVGNESIDQLTKFNRALTDFSGSRRIDGMILTKFDTIDDKVGAALNMCWVTGQAIFFVGTGQTYTDLKRLNVKSIVKSLLAD